jgi:hypothetical protein
MKHHVYIITSHGENKPSVSQEEFRWGWDPSWNFLVTSEPLRNFLYHSADSFGVLFCVLKSTW